MRRTHRSRQAMLALGLACLAVTITARPAAADPPTNASFEQPDLNPNSTITVCEEFGPGLIPGWVVVGCVDVSNEVAATHGAQHVDLDGADFSTPSNGGLQQVFDTLPDTGYTISWNFGASQLDSSGELQTGTFSVEGAAVEVMSVARNSPTDPNWQTRTTTFTGTGGPVTLQFADTGDNDGTGLLIDNIVIAENSEIPVVDPKVAGLVITMAAGGGLYLLHRKRNRDAFDGCLAA